MSMHLTEQLLCRNFNGCTTKHNERQFKIMQVLHGKQIVLHCFSTMKHFTILPFVHSKIVGQR